MTLFRAMATAGLLATAPLTAHAQDADLPRTLVWTSYDPGSTGYVEASAMADALNKSFGTKVRLTPSGTAIGRLLPMRKGRAQYGVMGNEILFAAEADYEFAAKDCGPQDIRVMLGRPAAVGLVAGGIRTSQPWPTSKAVAWGLSRSAPPS